MASSRMTGSTRTIWIMAIVAVLSLGAGILLSQLITSPADAAADAAPPEAGPITVPVESRTLANDVVLRADVIYEDPANITLETGDIGGPAVVTGQVPAVGDTIEAGTVMLEVSSRPVILLTGDLPVFRTMRAGVSGADVQQLRAALAELGIDAGDPAKAEYDAALAEGVRALYNKIGYEPPTAGGQEEIDAARDRVRMAESTVAQAQKDLANPEGGATERQKLNAIEAADRAFVVYNDLLKLCEADPNPLDRDGNPLFDPVSGFATCSPDNQNHYRWALRTAEDTRDEALKPVDTTYLQQALDSARRELSDAQKALADAQAGTLTPLPASEVVFLGSTPRRVDTVSVQRGSMVAGTAVMSVSGATMQISGNIASVDAELVTVGTPVVISMPGGGTVPGTVQEIKEPEGASETRKRVIITPDELTEEQRLELQYSNVRVTIPVASTDGDVLAVPSAALTAGPGGEARVERLDADGATTLVTVTTGLAAGGFVEITPVDGDLEEGDRVVVGVISGGTGTDEESDEPTEEDSPADEETTTEEEA